jgi:hypothetical protein
VNHPSPPNVTIHIFDIDKTTVKNMSIQVDRDISIGRSIECDINIDECFTSVSRYHAYINHEGGFLIFKDNNSRFGSHLNGVAIHELTLQPRRKYEFILGEGSGRALIQMEFEQHDRQPGAPAFTRIDSIATRKKILAGSFSYGPSNVREVYHELNKNIPLDQNDHRQLIQYDSTSTSRYARAYQVAYITEGERAPDDIYSNIHAGEIQELIRLVVTQEAPISIALLSRRIAPYWGMQKSSAKFREKMHEESTSMENLITLEEDDKFIYLKSTPPDAIDFFRTRTSDKRTHRDPDDIPIAEICIAAKAVRHSGGFGIAPSELYRRTADELGFSRLGTNVATRMQLALRSFHS